MLMTTALNWSNFHHFWLWRRVNQWLHIHDSRFERALGCGSRTFINEWTGIYFPYQYHNMTCVGFCVVLLKYSFAFYLLN